MENIFQIVKKAENNLIHGKPIKRGKYTEHDHVEKISTIDAYINSQHISGKKDSLEREKPFFNIVLTATYAWYKLTDIDRKHIRFTPANSKQRLKALIATIRLRNWMNNKNFGAFLNKWGWTLATYGSCVTKFVEKEGKLIPSVIDWDRMICDPVDFEGNIKIEKLYFTPAQLRKQPYDPEAVEDAIKAFQENRETIDGEDIDIKNEYIGVYEAHGELPLSLLTEDEEDEHEYVQQMHILFMEQNKKDEKKPYRISLYAGKEKQDPYYLSHLIEQDGRTLSMGAVETLFDAQWMVNHTAKLVKDQLDLASKLAMQTADPNFLGRNLVTDYETGSVLIHEDNKPLTQVNNQSHDIPSLMNFGESWRSQSRQISGAHESVTGEQPPSGTPYALQAMLSAEARGLFDIMRQSKGLHLEEMLRMFIIPHFKKTLKNTDEIVALLDGEELEQFDDLSLPGRLHQELMARLTKDHIPSREELMMGIEDQMNAMGNTRIIKTEEGKTWADYLKDLDMNALEIEITGENRDKQTILTTLDALLQRLMMNPEALQDENVRKIFNRIIDEVGPGVLSPLQVSVPERATSGEPQRGGGQVDTPLEMLT